MRYFVSGHLDISADEFAKHYIPKLRLAVTEEATFVVGDAAGVDKLAQIWLYVNCPERVTVYHMLDKPRNYVGFFPKVGGFKSDDERDAAMTSNSDADIAWVRPGKEKSGTANNLARRAKS